jgi:hypothetical protein
VLFNCYDVAFTVCFPDVFQLLVTACSDVMGCIEFGNLTQHSSGCQVRSLNLTSSSMDNQLQPCCLARRLLAGATVVTILCSQYTTLLMSSQSVLKAHWNPQETQVLFASITPLLTLGPPKTLKSCKNKWALVCYFA